jgi:hypothetical protein
LIYTEGRFEIDGVETLTTEAILELDKQGHLVWAYGGLREWVQAIEAARRTAPTSTLPPGDQLGRAVPQRLGLVSDAPRMRVAERLKLRPWVVALVLAFTACAFVATIAQGGYARNGLGMAFTLVAVVLAVMLIVGRLRTKSSRARVRDTPALGSTLLRLPLVLICLCAAAFVAGALLWWLPHYQVVAPADRRLILDTTPTMTLRVKNRGLLAGTYVATYRLAGKLQSVVRVRLAAGEESPVTLRAPADLSSGRYSVQLGSLEVIVQALHPAKFRVGELQVRRAVVKTGEKIDVQVSVENIGDISGTFSGVLQVDGQQVDAQPTDIAPQQSAALSFAVTQASTGPCRLQLGDASRTVMVVHPSRPSNGYILRRQIAGGRGRLTIRNGYPCDAMVMLTPSGSAPTPVLGVYVREGDNVTVDNIPDGSYVLWQCAGMDWNAFTRDFLSTLERKRQNDTLDFTTTMFYWDSPGFEYSGHGEIGTDSTVTLSAGYDERTSFVDASRFPRL